MILIFCIKRSQSILININRNKSQKSWELILWTFILQASCATDDCIARCCTPMDAHLTELIGSIELCWTQSIGRRDPPVFPSAKASLLFSYLVPFAIGRYALHSNCSGVGDNPGQRISIFDTVRVTVRTLGGRVGESSFGQWRIRGGQRDRINNKKNV